MSKHITVTAEFEDEKWLAIGHTVLVGMRSYRDGRKTLVFHVPASMHVRLVNRQSAIGNLPLGRELGAERQSSLNQATGPGGGSKAEGLPPLLPPAGNMDAAPAARGAVCLEE